MYLGCDTAVIIVLRRNGLSCLSDYSVKRICRSAVLCAYFGSDGLESRGGRGAPVRIDH